MNIAITGGIGCGKSAVLQILRKLGKHCISCDEINAKLLEEDFYVEIIRKEFPSVVSDGVINKKALSDIIFRSQSQRKKLNEIAHPIIKERFISMLSDKEDNFVEIPILTEDDVKGVFDRVWVVNCGYKNRLERIMLRDNIDSDYASMKIFAQKQDYEYSVAVDTITNNNNIHNLEKHIEYLLEKL